MITVQNDDEEGQEEESEDKKLIVDEPQLFIHAMEGTFNYQTMRIKGSVGKRSLCILIASRSTHNFINENIVRKMRCVMEYINDLRVLTANGNVLKCKEVQKVFLGHAGIEF